MKKVLITGGAGFIGSRLAYMLVSEGFSVVILDTLSSQVHGDKPQIFKDLKEVGCQFIVGSVTNSDDVSLALKGVHIVVHLASETGTGQSMYEISKYNHTNVYGTAVLLEEIEKHKINIEQIILASSRSVYGEGAYTCISCADKVYPTGRLEQDLKAGFWEPRCPRCNGSVQLIPTSETDPVNPQSIYAATKLFQEHLVKIFSEKHGIKSVIFRLQNVYGAGQSLNNPYTGILTVFSNKIRSNLPLPVFEDGEETRDFVFVEDIVNAIKEVIYNKDNCAGIFNLGSGQCISINRLAEILISRFKSTSIIKVTGEYRIGDIRHNVADITNFSCCFPNFKFTIFEDGVQEFTDWVHLQNIFEDKVDAANSQLISFGLMGKSFDDN